MRTKTKAKTRTYRSAVRVFFEADVPIPDKCPRCRVSLLRGDDDDTFSLNIWEDANEECLQAKVQGNEVVTDNWGYTRTSDPSSATVVAICCSKCEHDLVEGAPALVAAVPQQAAEFLFEAVAKLPPRRRSTFLEHLAERVAHVQAGGR